MKTQFNIFLSVCVVALIVTLIAGVRYLYYKIKTEKYTKWYNTHHTKYMQDDNITLQDNYRNIFCYWDNDNLPPIVNECIKNIKKKLGYNWNIILLNKNSVYKLIPIHNFPNNYEKLFIQAKADWIRLYLIKTYGGLWLDISILINDHQEIEDMYNKIMFENKELCIYEMPHHRINIDRKIYPGLECWFIMAKPNNDLITEWLNEFNYAIEIGLDNYLKYILKNNFILSKEARNSKYFTAYRCVQVVMQTKCINFRKIYVKDARLSMYKIFNRPKKIIEKKVDHNIKLITNDRKYLENYSIEDFFNLYFN
jgi:hypothetical protein